MVPGETQVSNIYFINCKVSIKQIIERFKKKTNLSRADIIIPILFPLLQRSSYMSSTKNQEEVEEMNAPSEAPELVEESKEEPEFLRNLCILPPRQKNSPVTKERLAKDAILLPPISPSEPISAIRGAIAEIRGLAHITNYRLVLEDLEENLLSMIVSEHKKRSNVEGKAVSGGDVKVPFVDENSNGTETKKNNKKKKVKSAVSMSDIVSPYTCDQGSVEIPSIVMSDECEDVVLNEYELLSSMVDSGELRSNMGFRMVLERYNEGTLKDHVQRTRVLLDGNIPYVLGLVGANETEQEAVEEIPSTEAKEQGQTTADDAKDSVSTFCDSLKLQIFFFLPIL